MTAGPTVRMLRRIDAACDRFEEEWLAGDQPRLQDYLEKVDADERPVLLHALSQVQQELLLRHFDEREPLVEFIAADESASSITPPASVEDSSNETPEVRVILTVTDGPHRGQRFVFDRHETLLAGRSVRARLRLEDDRHFSRHHFRLEINPPQVHLIDLDSRNGTFVNGKQVHEQSLIHNDVISVGKTKLRIEIVRNRKTAELQRHADGGTSETCSSEMSDDSFNDEAVRMKRRRGDVRSESVPGASPTAAILPRIAGYELTDCLGPKGIGTAYRAIRLATREDCLLKVLPLTESFDDQRVRSFLREMRVMSQLEHRHLVRLIDVGAENHSLFLSTEWLDELPWDSVLNDFSPEGRIRLACGVACQILSGLHHAHTRSLVHRDIQPSNILVTRNGGKYLAKLADFGLAKNYTNAGLSRLTRTGDVIGSLAYISPEQFMDSRQARPACDIYSLGATLYRLLSHRDPFDFDRKKCRFLSILEDEPTPLKKLLPEAPEALAEVIHRALSKEPADRFASAAEMRHNLVPFARR